MFDLKLKPRFTGGSWVATQYGYEKYSINGINGEEVCSTHNPHNAALLEQSKNMYELLVKLIDEDNCKKDIVHLLVDAEVLLYKIDND